MNNSDMKKLVFIMNPKAGVKKKDGFLVDVINEFEDNGYTTEMHFTRAQGDGTRLAVKYGHNTDLLVCMGGDGTLNEVIEGIIEGGIQAPLGYIPAGSTNDFAASLGIPTVPLEAAQEIMKREPKLIDMGRFNNRYYVYTASCGIFTRTSYSTSQSFKNIFGHFAYVLAGVKDLTKVKKLNLKIVYDEGVIEDTFIFASICNSTSIGGIMQIDKTRVDFCDGKFEMLLIKFPKDIVELGAIITKLQSQVYDDRIRLVATSKATITGCEGVDWSLDGEKEEAKDEVEFEVFHNAVKLIY